MTVLALEARIPAPIVAVVVAGAMRLLAPSVVLPAAGSPRDLVHAAIAIASGIIAVAAFFSFWRARTTIDPRYPERASTLLTQGVFRLSRNPLYLSLALLLLAYAVKLGGVVAFVGPAFFVAYVTRFQILAEERAMQAKFGQAWMDYASTVRRWI